MVLFLEDPREREREREGFHQNRIKVCGFFCVVLSIFFFVHWGFIIKKVEKESWIVFEIERREREEFRYFVIYSSKTLHSNVKKNPPQHWKNHKGNFSDSLPFLSLTERKRENTVNVYEAILWCMHLGPFAS